MPEKHILVIDDDEQIRLLLRQTLEGAGLAVTTTENGHEGLKLCRDGVVDLVITDMLMPELDGISVIKNLKKINSTLPVIGISGGSMTLTTLDFIQMAQSNGADIAFAKPFDLLDILLEVNILLWDRYHQTSISPKSVSPILLIVDDDPQVREFLQLILEPSASQIITAADMPSAQTLYEKHHPHIIFTDIHMPHSENASQEQGFLFVRWIREKQKDDQVKVVALSGFLDGNLSGRLVALDCYPIQKPLDSSLGLKLIAYNLWRQYQVEARLRTLAMMYKERLSSREEVVS